MAGQVVEACCGVDDGDGVMSLSFFSSLLSLLSSAGSGSRVMARDIGKVEFLLFFSRDMSATGPLPAKSSIFIEGRNCNVVYLMASEVPDAVSLTLRAVVDKNTHVTAMIFSPLCALRI